MLLASALAAPSVVYGDSNEPDPAQVAEAIEFRSQTGLAADAATIRASLRETDQYLDHSFGVPLTSAEAAHVTRVIDAQVALLPVLESTSKLPEFSTAYFSGDVLHIRTIDPAAVEGMLASVAPEGSRIEVHDAVASHLELARLQDQIARDVDELGSLGIAVVKVGINPYSAKTEVAIRTPVDTSKTLATLLDRYGADVEVVLTDAGGGLLACNSRFDCGTKGGLAAVHAVGGGTLYCSTAFVVRDNSSASRYLMTAGHCIQQSGGVGGPGVWRNQAGTLNWGSNVRLYVSVNFDEGIFRLGALPPAYNQYFAQDKDHIRSVTHDEMTYAEMPAGMTVCRSARTTGWKCNSIHRANIDWYDGSAWHWGVWEVSHTSASGDSGAGYIVLAGTSGAFAAGILFGGETGIFARYTYYYPAIDDWAIGVHVCITAAC